MGLGPGSEVSSERWGSSRAISPPAVAHGFDLHSDAIWCSAGCMLPSPLTFLSFILFPEIVDPSWKYFRVVCKHFSREWWHRKHKGRLAKNKLFHQMTSEVSQREKRKECSGSRSLLPAPNATGQQLTHSCRISEKEIYLFSLPTVNISRGVLL